MMGSFDDVPGSQFDGIFYFVHLSDLHLSDMHPERAKDFGLFCNQTLPVLQPELVVITGDLTHAVTQSGLSHQRASEWNTYSKIVHEAGYFNASIWLDSRGNHDNRDVDGDRCQLTLLMVPPPSLDLGRFLLPSLYLKHSVSGIQRERPFFAHTVQKPFGKYRFISLDGSQVTLLFSHTF